MRCNLSCKSDNGLTLFHSKHALVPILTYLFIIACLLIGFLPGYSFFKYAFANKTPIMFFVLFISSLIWISYFHLSCGRGEYLDREALSKLKFHGKPFIEEQLDFFSHTLPGFILHISIVQMILLPFHILAAAMSGISLQLLLISLFILFMSSLIARSIGFLSFLWFGLWNNKGYIISRFLFLLFMGLSWVLYPAGNPVYIIYRIHREQAYGGFSIKQTGIQILLDILLAMILIMSCQVTLQAKKRR